MVYEVKVFTPILMGTSTRGGGMMAHITVKGLSLGLMEINMKENGRMGNKMV